MNWSERCPLIAILRGVLPQEVLSHAQAAVAAGFDTVEIPLNSPHWQQSLAILVANMPFQVLLGAGTVLSVADVQAVHAAGGRLIVTPNTRPAVIAHAQALGMQVVAGFATPTEAFDALEAGAHALKLFPANSFGPDYVKSLKAVLPKNVPLFAVGGITPSNLASFMQAGCSGAGLGGELYRAGQSVAQTAASAQAFISALGYRKPTAAQSSSGA